MAPTKTKILATAPSADEVAKAYEAARTTLTDKLSIPVGKLSANDLKKLGDQATASKQNVNFTATFDGEWLELEAVIGTRKNSVSSVNVKALGDEKKVYGILKKLAAYGLAATPVDPEETAQWRRAVTELEQNLERLKDIKESYSKFNYDTDNPAIYSVLEEWAAKHSQKHYLDFLGEITAKTAPQKIFDTYVKKGAKYPVNLSAAVAAAIEKDLKAGKTPNLVPAQKEILGVVNTKMIPKFRAKMLAEIAAGKQKTEQDLAAAKKHLKPVGAK